RSNDVVRFLEKIVETDLDCQNEAHLSLRDLFVKKFGRSRNSRCESYEPGRVSTLAGRCIRATIASFCFKRQPECVRATQRLLPFNWQPRDVPHRIWAMSPIDPTTRKFKVAFGYNKHKLLVDFTDQMLLILIMQQKDT
ncbi:hypothetical protein KIN20_025059, partial [Parelaphostrongylus tenuis]